MGNEESKPQLYTRISRALPPLAPQYGLNENIDWVDKGTKAFASEGDREQFICTSKVNQVTSFLSPSHDNTYTKTSGKETGHKNLTKNTDALISLLTSNGTLALETHTIKLLFSRRQLPPSHPSHPQQQQTPSSPNKPPNGSPWRNLVTPSSSKEEPDDGTRLLATLVAIDEKGVITTKIEPEGDGRNVAEAFRSFKRDVEIQLERLLRGVPMAVGVVTGCRRRWMW